MSSPPPPTKRKQIASDPSIERNAETMPTTTATTTTAAPASEPKTTAISSAELAFETCQCPIIPDVTPLPLSSSAPTPDCPTLPGQCIYHHRLSTREAESKIFDDLAPEMSELKKVLSTGLVRYMAAGLGGQMVRAEKEGSTRQATQEELKSAKDDLKKLIEERNDLVEALWNRFVGRWGGAVKRKDDGTMFVVDEGRRVKEEAETVAKEGDDGDGDGKGEAGEADPYVQRMMEVQARMDDLKASKESQEKKRAKAQKAAEEYAG